MSESPFSGIEGTADRKPQLALAWKHHSRFFGVAVGAVVVVNTRTCVARCAYVVAYGWLDATSWRGLS